MALPPDPPMAPIRAPKPPNTTPPPTTDFGYAPDTRHVLLILSCFKILQLEDIVLAK